jgi:hypothetical protein
VFAKVTDPVKSGALVVIVHVVTTTPLKNTFIDFVVLNEDDADKNNQSCNVPDGLVLTILGFIVKSPLTVDVAASNEPPPLQLTSISLFGDNPVTVIFSD